MPAVQGMVQRQAGRDAEVTGGIKGHVGGRLRVDPCRQAADAGECIRYIAGDRQIGVQPGAGRRRGHVERRHLGVLNHCQVGKPPLRILVSRDGPHAERIRALAQTNVGDGESAITTGGPVSIVKV